MRRLLICTLAVAAAALDPVAMIAAAAPAHGPTPAQVRTAVTRAERSGYLWATVNVCAARGGGRGGLMGVRGEMPALGFPATLSMTVALGQYSTKRRAYVPVPGATATRTVSLGAFTAHVHQGGAEFPFRADPGRLDARVSFTWTRAGQRIGQVSQTTTGGHPQAAFGRPRHHSAASCRL